MKKSILLGVFFLTFYSVTVQAGKKLLVSEDINLTKNHFESETRLGGIITSGNTESISISGSNLTLYRIKRFQNTWKAGALYNRINSTTGSATVGTAARYIHGTYRLDYFFLPLTTIYAGGGGYTDEITGIELAGQGFAGVHHYLVRNDTIHFGGSTGYDFVYEDRVAPAVNDDIHSAALELLFKYFINEYVQFSQDVEAKENIQNGQDFRLNSNTEIKVALNSHLSFISGFKLRFDNVPVPGFKKLDTITHVSLALNF
jgi:putative salt-induced outer membrane protein YdiY